MADGLNHCVIENESKLNPSPPVGFHLVHVALMNRTNSDFGIIMMQCFFMTKYPLCASGGTRAPLILIEITASVSSNGSEDKFVIEMSERCLQKSAIVSASSARNLG